MARTEQSALKIKNKPDFITTVDGDLFIQERFKGVKMFKVECGPTAFFDCDDTLVMWDIPEGHQEADRVTIKCRDFVEHLVPNTHNIDLLIKFAKRGHYVVVWSAGGSDWAEAVVKALKLEEYVEVVTAKPTYFIDDIADPSEWMGKRGYFDIDGNRCK